MDERRRLFESLTGSVGSKTVALAIEDSPKETLLSQALALRSAEAGKLATTLLARFNRPRFRLRVLEVSSDGVRNVLAKSGLNLLQHDATTPAISA